MSVNWTKEIEMLFLEYYQAEPILWDPNDKNHKNKLKIYDAWMRISVIMEISVLDLKKKRDSLLSSYRSYKTKVKKSLNSGAGADEVYKPVWFAYELMDAFLNVTTKCNKTIETETQPQNAGSIEKENEPPRGSDQEGRQGNQTEYAFNQNVNTESSAIQTIRRRRNPPELLEAGKVVKEALDTFATTLKRNDAKNQPTEVDDCDLYAQLLAKKLRKMPEEKRLKFMHDIDGMFLRSQYDYQSETYLSPMPSPSPPQSLFHRPSTSASSYYDSAIHYTPRTTQITDLHRRPSTTSSSQSITDSHRRPASSSQSITDSPRRPSTASSSQSITDSPRRPSTASSSQSITDSPRRPSTASSSQSITDSHRRPSTASPSQSMPATYYTPNYTPIVIQGTSNNKGSKIVIKSNELIYPPVIHIPDQDEYIEENVGMSQPNIIENAFNMS